MCKSKASGGRRCHSHVSKEQLSVTGRIARQERKLAFLSEREQATGQLTLTQSAERKAVTENLTELVTRKKSLNALLAQIETENEERHNAAEESRERALAAAVTRMSRGTLGEGRGRPRLNLTPTEMTALKERARAAGKSVSLFVSDLAAEPPVFVERGADGSLRRINESSEWKNPGRKPQSKEGSTIAASPTAGFSAERYERLTAEAGAFGLTTADYLRRRILGVDPRVRGNHMSTYRQDAEIGLLMRYEAEAGIGEAPDQLELWAVYSARADAIQEAQRKAQA